MSVREPDEATIRIALGWHCLDGGNLGASHCNYCACQVALDRLVADRDRWKWGRDWQAEKATAWAKRCFAAEAEVAVLTARLDASERDQHRIPEPVGDSQEVPRSGVTSA